jgi:hypothetical protein
MCHLVTHCWQGNYRGLPVTPNNNQVPTWTPGVLVWSSWLGEPGPKPSLEQGRPQLRLGSRRTCLPPLSCASTVRRPQGKSVQKWRRKALAISLCASLSFWGSVGEPRCINLRGRWGETQIPACRRPEPRSRYGQWTTGTQLRGGKVGRDEWQISAHSAKTGHGISPPSLATCRATNLFLDRPGLCRSLSVGPIWGAVLEGRGVY